MNFLIYLSFRDTETLAEFTHPETGVRFSPYGHVNMENDLVFLKSEIGPLIEDQTVYTWGTYYDSDELIQMTFSAYLDTFIYDRDYVASDMMTVNERLGLGNTIDNTAEVYPEALIVDFHFQGIDDKLNWRSIRIVLEEFEREWHVIGVIHDRFLTNTK